MRRICAITGTRADYGLLYWTLDRIRNDARLKLQLCATGMHLSPEFGLTYQEIEKDGFEIDRKIEMLLSSDSSVGVSKSIGIGVIGFAEAFDQLRPDLILLLGDRFETLAAATAALIARIPIAHCHGGETTEGVIDESIRHSITKMSQLHFTSTDAYKRRVVQLGENPAMVFNVGALGIENINKLKLLDKKQFDEKIGLPEKKRRYLITFHPVTLENRTASAQFQSLLNAVDKIEDAQLIFTKPNADPDGRVIIGMIDEFVSRKPEKSVAFTSMGQLLYLSALKHCTAVVGNSSSGLLEAPSIPIATINIGDRQKGRERASSVIDVGSDETEIYSALQKIEKEDYQRLLRNVVNPYGKENASEKIVDTLATVSLDGILKKTFFDQLERI